MKEVREYAQSYVDVEDFKAITRNMEQKGRNIEKAKKPAERHDRGKKLVRTKDLDVPELNNYANYTPLKESMEKNFNVHKENTRWQSPSKGRLLEKNPEALCKFHECLGHWTEHFKSLMNNIEDLIHTNKIEILAKDSQKADPEKKSKPEMGKSLRIKRKKKFLSYFRHLGYQIPKHI